MVSVSGEGEERKLPGTGFQGHPSRRLKDSPTLARAAAVSLAARLAMSSKFVEEGTTKELTKCLLISQAAGTAR